MTQPAQDDSPRQERKPGGNVPSGCFICDYDPECRMCDSEPVPVQRELVDDVSG